MCFADQGTADIYHGVTSKRARQCLPEILWQRAATKIQMIIAAEALRDLQVPPSNRLEALQGNRKGQYSLRINQQYRICFSWSETGAYAIEIVDYH